ncbi:uncharacterized protein LOC144666868 isoform X1 [Oculina patagonica]
MSEAIEMEAEDHEDLSAIWNSLPKDNIPEDMKCLWEQQNKLARTKKNGYRWHPKIMRLCIELYCKNPRVLDPLREVLILPSNKTIRQNKNRVEETSGWNDKTLLWCLNDAKKQGLKEADFWGGFAIDEMKIQQQENLEMAIKNGKHRLIGFVDLGEGHDLMRSLSGKTEEPELATHVLQFIFVSDCGFRFPIAQFPSGDCTPSDLYFLFWEGVLKMLEIGFVVYWCVMDGADCNRQFVKIHFKDKDPVEDKFVTHNIYTGGPMVFIMDPKHNIKKIRNNVQKSNVQGKPRCLKLGRKAVTWQQFRQAFNWDQECFSLPLHERLTPQHFELDSAAKMRNHLAEDVLDCKMLFLMQKYQEHLNATGKDGSTLNSAITLLQHTSEITSLFNDKLYINTTSDGRLKKLDAFYKLIVEWDAQTKEKRNEFISSKLWFDLQSMCLGFQSLITIKLTKFPNPVIKPSIVNQDCVENHFCQIRSCNGQNDNPTFLQQQSTQNSIRLGQTTISPKSNAGKSK